MYRFMFNEVFGIVQHINIQGHQLRSAETGMISTVRFYKVRRFCTRMQYYLFHISTMAVSRMIIKTFKYYLKVIRTIREHEAWPPIAASFLKSSTKKFENCGVKTTMGVFPLGFEPINCPLQAIFY